MNKLEVKVNSALFNEFYCESFLAMINKIKVKQLKKLDSFSVRK